MKSGILDRLKTIVQVEQIYNYINSKQYLNMSQHDPNLIPAGAIVNGVKHGKLGEKHRKHLVISGEGIKNGNFTRVEIG